MDAADGDGVTPRAAGYRRSARSPRGEARRRELLDRVTDDLAANGLMMDASLWDGVIPELSAGYRCVAPTLPLGAHRHAMRTHARGASGMTRWAFRCDP